MLQSSFLCVLPPADFSDDLWNVLSKEDRPIVVYGMGNGADKLAARLALFGKEIADFFASDGFVRGQSFRGKRVLSFSEICEKYTDFVVLVSFGTHLESVVSVIYSMAEKHQVYIPDMPLAGDAYFDADFYRAHYEEILHAYSLLCDGASRVIYAACVWYKLTGRAEYLKRAVGWQDEQELLGFSSMRCAVDVGAYRGDTLLELIHCAPHLTQVYAVEPDRKNFCKLEKAAENYADACSITCVCAAAWDEDGNLPFSVSGNRNATLLSTGLKESYEGKKEDVRVVKLDTLLLGKNVDYIKYDTEGAEEKALEGTRNTITACTPSLLVSAYHKSEDIFSLLLWLDKKFPQRYDFFFRRSDCIPAWEMHLIACPKKR